MIDPDDSHDPVTAPWAAALLDFWFGEIGEKGWWSHDPALDRLCTDRWSALWEDKRGLAATAFLDRADEALAAILLFDQIPRNMFRHTARAFATDDQARDIARGAIAQGYDIQVGGAGRSFFYMPFMHSEDEADQTLSITLFEGLGDDNALNFARQHHAMIARFGRFPHRNAALGRPTRLEELDAVAAGEHW